jgi:tetratricopeptide (TPR) repeat protein
MHAGMSFAQQELYSEAAQAFARCARDFPAVFEAHYNLALAYLALQKHEEAWAALEKAPQASSRQRSAQSYMKGKILLATDRLDEAERELSAAFQATPREENYALDLGLLRVRERNQVGAIEVFSQGVSYHPRSAPLLLGLSLAQLLGGQRSESIQSSQRLLKLDPAFGPAQLLLAFTLYHDGQLEEARKTVVTALSKPNPHPYVRYLHAAVLQKLQSTDYETILSELSLASRSIPGCALCYLGEAKVYRAQGKFELAIGALEKAVRLDPSFSEAWYHLSIVYGRAGRKDDASKASAEFSRLKSEKTNRETELLRTLFLQTMSQQ